MSSSDRYIEFIRKWITGNPDALAWTALYGIYAHAIDDIIDGDKTDSLHILNTFEMGACLYMHPFCREYHHILYSLIMMAHQAYRDSVILEKCTDVEWKAKVADSLRQVGNEVVLAIIGIVRGIEAKREAALELREIAYFTHHTLDGKPI